MEVILTIEKFRVSSLEFRVDSGRGTRIPQQRKRGRTFRGEPFGWALTTKPQGRTFFDDLVKVRNPP